MGLPAIEFDGVDEKEISFQPGAPLPDQVDDGDYEDQIEGDKPLQQRRKRDECQDADSSDIAELLKYFVMAAVAVIALFIGVRRSR